VERWLSDKGQLSMPEAIKDFENEPSVEHTHDHTHTHTHTIHA
jgi:hypothetical protein